MNRLSDFGSNRKRGLCIKPSELNYTKWNNTLLHELEKAEDEGVELKKEGKLENYLNGKELIFAEIDNAFLQN